MDKEICGISSKGFHYVATRDVDVFRVEAKEDFVSGLTNPLKTVDSTVGGMHRAQLHELLDEWIDNAIRARALHDMNQAAEQNGETL